jgi:feruloyl esterase
MMDIPVTRRARYGFAALISVFLCGCGGSDDEAPTVVDAAPVKTFAERCSALAGSAIPAADIGLPTKGATITSAVLVAAGGTGSGAKPEYCKVLADINSIDPAAQPIKIQVNLPSVWNAKAFQLGGGGFDGSIPEADGPFGFAPDQPGPLYRGYATFAGNGGHQGALPDDHSTAFLNDEVVANYSGAQLKKSRDAAVYLMRVAYDKNPDRTYFFGGSGGGREAFYAVQRQAQDYDGVIAYYPAWPLNEMLLNYGRLARALAQPGAYPSVAKQTLLYESVIKACDGLDGAADGLVSNVNACNFKVAALRCPNGADAGDTCLSDAQIAALDAHDAPLVLPFTVASGETGFPRFNIYSGVDPRGIIGLGSLAPASNPVPPQPFSAWVYDTYAKGLLTRSMSTNWMTIDPTALGPYEQRSSDLSSLLDMNKTDLSAFRGKGAKLIIVHGKADETIPTATSAAYYDRLVNTMGVPTVKDFVRYYEIPGFGHGSGAFRASWDAVGAIENWVEKGSAPLTPVVKDINSATANRTRPLCDYPSWPKYKGSGDINTAASYTCATN